MALFDNINPKEFILFGWNHNMKLDASGKLIEGAKVKYTCALPRGDLLFTFEALCRQIGNTTSLYLEEILLGSGTYVF